MHWRRKWQPTPVFLPGESQGQRSLVGCCLWSLTESERAPLTEGSLLCSAAAAKSLQSCPTLWDPTDGSPPGSSIPGILQARTLEWVAISFSNACMHAKSLQSCPTLCYPIDGSPPGSSVPGILQARILKWVAISFSFVQGGTNLCLRSLDLR